MIANVVLDAVKMASVDKPKLLFFDKETNKSGMHPNGTSRFFIGKTPFNSSKFIV